VQNYRINGAKVRLNASPADAYFLFCKEALLNFYTMGLYAKCPCRCGPCKNRISYERWLDKRVEWVGAPPAGTNNEFQIFNDKLVCTQKLNLMCLECWCGCIPFFQLYSATYSYKMRLGNLTFGGIQVTHISIHQLKPYRQIDRQTKVRYDDSDGETARQQAGRQADRQAGRQAGRQRVHRVM